MSWHVFVLESRVPWDSITVVQMVLLITILRQPVIAVWGACLIVLLAARSHKASGLPWKRSAVKYSATLLITMLLHLYFCYYLRVVDYVT